jgi:hypothetical protein
MKKSSMVENNKIRESCEMEDTKSANNKQQQNLPPTDESWSTVAE